MGIPGDDAHRSFRCRRGWVFAAAFDCLCGFFIRDLVQVQRSGLWGRSPLRLTFRSRRPSRSLRQRLLRTLKHHSKHNRHLHHKTNTHADKPRAVEALSSRRSQMPPQAEMSVQKNSLDKQGRQVSRKRRADKELSSRRSRACTKHTEQ